MEQINRLQKLLACSGNKCNEHTEILKEIVNNSETCIRYRKPKHKLVVRLSTDSSYKEKYSGTGFDLRTTFNLPGSRWRATQGTELTYESSYEKSNLNYLLSEVW